MAKEKPGDGSKLKPVAAWQFIWRSVLGIDYGGTRWDIDVDFFDWNERVYLYRDGHQDRIQRGTSTFHLDDHARIEVAWSTYGLRRAHLVHPDGHPQQLIPARGTAERWRADLDRDHPDLSRWIGIVSWTVLVIALVLQLPQLVALIGVATGWFEFTSPISLPGRINSALGTAAIVAGIERALRLRHHWLLD